MPKYTLNTPMMIFSIALLLNPVVAHAVLGDLDSSSRAAWFRSSDHPPRAIGSDVSPGNVGTCTCRYLT
jgi:hypothetical protein